MPVLVRSIRVALTGLVAALTFAMFSSSAGANAAVKEPSSSAPRVLIPDFPKLFQEGKKKKKGFVSRRGVFRVRMVGYQINRWSVHSPPDGICSGETLGNGFERVVFRFPAKRMKLSAFGKRRLTSMILPRMKVRGQLTRKGSYSYTPLENPAPDCPYGDGGGDYVPTPPDCGTRRFKGIPMSLFALDGFFQLRSEASFDRRPKFRNCPSPRVEWPTIIREKTNGKPIQTRFPGRLFFNRKFDRKTGKWSKVIVLAKGAKKQRSFTSANVTRLQWKLVVKRLR